MLFRSAVAVVYLVIQILKAVFWLVYQVIKLTIYLHVLLAYSLIWLFIILPVELIFSNKRMSESWAEFKKNFKAITNGFYPPAKKIEVPAAAAQPAAAPAPTYIIIPAAVAATTTPTTPPKVKIAQIPQTPAPESIKFHCSNCGQEFSRSMGSLLAQKGQAYCEHCGQAYGMEGQIPYPIQA